LHAATLSFLKNGVWGVVGGRSPPTTPHTLFFQVDIVIEAEAVFCGALLFYSYVPQSLK
jgi:hypothetical protein